MKLNSKNNYAGFTLKLAAGTRVENCIRGADVVLNLIALRGYVLSRFGHFSFLFGKIPLYLKKKFKSVKVKENMASDTIITKSFSREMITRTARVGVSTREIKKN